MSEHDEFERILELINEAMLDETRWPVASALIDEVCGLVGNGLFVFGAGQDLRVRSAGIFCRGHRREDLERDYLEHYHPTDEGVPRFRHLPLDRLTHISDLYGQEERRTSRTLNEFLPRVGARNGLSVRLRGMEGRSHIAWVLGDPVTGGRWRSSQVAMIGRICPHVRQFVVVRQAVEDADARCTSLGELLNSTGIGVVQLDRRGRIVEVNDFAFRLLEAGDGLVDREGFLQARSSDDNARLERLVAQALPDVGRASGASMTVRRSSAVLPCIVHVKPMTVRESGFRVSSPGALVLVTEPGLQFALDPLLVAAVLGLTPTESRLAVWLAQGKTVSEVARMTERQVSSVHWHLRQIYRKRGISRQADLVRLVLSVRDLG